MIIDDFKVPQYMNIVHKFAGIRSDGGYLQSTNWELKLQLVGNALIENHMERNQMAFNKILFWLESTLNNVIVFDPSDENSSVIAGMSENIFLLTPELPSDDVLIRVLHSKLTAIANNEVVIGEMTLETEGMPVSYTFNNHDGYDLPETVKDYIPDMVSLFKEPWWDRNDGYSFEFLKKRGDKRKIADIYNDIIDPLSEFEESVANYTELTMTPHTEAEIIKPNKWNPKKV